MSKDGGPPANSFAEPRLVGWLTKQGGQGIGSNWRKRYFVLDHHYLFYYKTDKDRKPVGVVCLGDYKSCHKASPKESKKNKCTFVIEKGDQADDLDYPVRNYYIYAENEVEMTTWIDCINEEIQPLVGSKVKIDDKAFDELSTTVQDGPKLTHPTAFRPKPQRRRPPRKYTPFHEDDSKEDSCEISKESLGLEPTSKKLEPKTPPNNRKVSPDISPVPSPETSKKNPSATLEPKTPPSYQKVSPDISPIPSETSKKGHRPVTPLKPKIKAISIDKEPEETSIPDTPKIPPPTTKPRPPPPAIKPKKKSVKRELEKSNDEHIISVISEYTKENPVTMTTEEESPVTMTTKENSTLNDVENQKHETNEEMEKKKIEEKIEESIEEKKTIEEKFKEDKIKDENSKVVEDVITLPTNENMLPSVSLPKFDKPPPPRKPRKPTLQDQTPQVENLVEPKVTPRPKPTPRPRIRSPSAVVISKKNEVKNGIDESVTTVKVEEVNETTVKVEDSVTKVKEENVIDQSLPPLENIDEEAVPIEGVQRPVAIVTKDESDALNPTIKQVNYENVTVNFKEDGQLTLSAPPQDTTTSPQDIIPSQDIPVMLQDSAVPSLDTVSSQDNTVLSQDISVPSQDIPVPTQDITVPSQDSSTTQILIDDISQEVSELTKQDPQTISPDADYPYETMISQIHLKENSLSQDEEEESGNSLRSPNSEKNDYELMVTPLTPPSITPTSHPDDDVYAVPRVTPSPSKLNSDDDSIYKVPRPHSISPDSSQIYNVPKIQHNTVDTSQIYDVPKSPVQVENEPVINKNRLSNEYNTPPVPPTNKTTPPSDEDLSHRDSDSVSSIYSDVSRQGPPPERDAWGYALVNKKSSKQSLSQIEQPHDWLALHLQKPEDISDVPENLMKAKEVLRLALIVKAEAEENRKEIEKELALARRERHDAELMKKNASEILKIAKERLQNIS